MGTGSRVPPAAPVTTRPMYMADARASVITMSDDMLAQIAAKAADPTVLDESREYAVIRLEISNGRADSYHTVMHESSLRNYVTDAENGVSLLVGHQQRQLPFGQSISARYIAESTGQPSRVEVDFVVIGGLVLNGINSSDIIVAVRGGIVRDCSVGFQPGRFECSFCGHDPYDWWDGDCVHVMGAGYDKDGKKPGDTVAFCWVKDAHLGEVSLVYDGATPGAGVVGVGVVDARAERQASRVLASIATGRLPMAEGLVLARAAGIDGGMIREAARTRERNADVRRQAPAASEPADPALDEAVRRLAQVVPAPRSGLTVADFDREIVELRGDQGDVATTPPSAEAVPADDLDVATERLARVVGRRRGI